MTGPSLEIRALVGESPTVEELTVLLLRERAARIAAESSGRRYRFLAKAIPQIVWTARPDGYLDSFNPRWSEYTGLTAEQSQGDGWHLVLHPEDGSRYLEAWRKALSIGEGYGIDLRIRRYDGLYRWHLLRALPVRDRSGHILKWLGTCTDIDDQKRAEGTIWFLSEVSTVLSSSLDYETTLASVARLTVPQVADWCVVDLAEADGSIRRLEISHPDPARVAQAWALVRSYPPRSDDLQGPARVLRTGTAELASEVPEPPAEGPGEGDAQLEVLGRELGIKSYIAAPLVARGRTLGVLTLATAESGRRYGPADVPLAEELARRVALAVDNARLYRDARQAREEAEAANRAKDQFLAVLSHELRTPLTPVLLSLTAMQESDAIAEDLRSTLEMIRRSVELEARLIDDLLDITRIARGKLPLSLEVVDVHGLIRQTAEICRSEIEKGRIQLHLDLAAERSHTRADPARLHQVLWNLVKNAVKFTPAEGTVAVRSRNEGDPERLVLEVSDTGIGIEPENLDRIFNAFDQGESNVTRRFGGLGLGLAISRALVRAHGGTLTARSAGAGQGATFRVELMTAVAFPSSEPLSPSRTAPSASRAALKILLVEDDETTLNVLTRLLSQSGHEVTAASSFQSAVEIGEGSDFDLIISDVGLPDGSGLDLIRRLRERRPTPGIALSGFGMDEDLARSQEAGFQAHLTKPVDFATLETAIHRVTSDGNDDSV
jgi:PAS domain S-box-containing protein